MTDDRIVDATRQSANYTRDTADEMAAMWGGCDDPLHPFMSAGDEQPFRNWHDFLDRVCIPLVEADGDDEAEQTAMALYRKANPHFIATCMVMAARSQPGGFIACSVEGEA